MRHLKISTILASAGIVLIASMAQAKTEVSATELLSLSLEQLGNIEVTSVSKKSEKANEAAAAIYVITQEDISRSGMTNIPELLRMVPGLNVAQSGSHQWSVSSRGFSGQFADTLLVLIDGRSVYTPLYSGVYWDVQDTLLQDIERIEVIRGPGATLWGANAVNGVINIITKNAKDSQGGYASQTVGNQANSLTSARYGAKITDNAYARVYAKYDDYRAGQNIAGKNANDPWNKAQSGFRSDWKNDNQTFTFQGDAYRSGERFDVNLFQPSGATVPTKVEDLNRGYNIIGKWDNKISSTSDLTLQLYYDDARRNNLVFDQDIQTLDFDLQHVWGISDRHEVISGAGYRYIKSSVQGNPGTALGVPYLQITPPGASYNLFSAFVQDKITLSPNSVFLTLGSKIEHNDFTGVEAQPSARLSWLVDEKQTLWSSVSRAVRTPNIGGTSNLRQVAAPTLLPGPTLAFLTQVGNKDAKSEELVAYEVGYRINPKKNVSIDVSAFYNDYSRLIIGVADTAGITTYGSNVIVPILPLNTGTAHTWGAESTAKWNPTSSLELAASYALLQMKFDQPDPLGYNFRNKSPQQTFNARATVQLPHDVEITSSAYFVDRLAAIDINTSKGIDEYTRFDTRIAWKPLDNLELSFVGQNLFDESHQEFGAFAYQNSSQVPRAFYGNISWKF